MTTALALRFPLGRYHGTPWGRAHNEAAVDFPPSPWRLLRALFATWQWRAPDLPTDTVLRLFGRLAPPPRYLVPEHALAHTRHYYPDIVSGTDKVFDAFASLASSDELIVAWDVSVADDERDALAELAGMLSYVGRADSVCDARLLDGNLPSDGSWIGPTADMTSDLTGMGLRLLVPTLPLDLSALTASPTAVRAAGHVLPPGASLCTYQAPALARPSTPTRRRNAAIRTPTVARWALTGPALPAVTAAVAMADLLRHAAMSRWARRHGDPPSALLAGKTSTGEPRTDQHSHAHYLAFGDLERPDGFLHSMAIWAPGGIGPAEVQALADLDALIGYSHVQDVRPCRLGLEALGDARTALPELIGPASRWRTLTPFAPAHHARRNLSWEDHVRRCVTDELAWRGFPPPAELSILGGPWLSYRRYRLRERLAEARRAIGIEVTFSAPTEGPISLGALSHFGLGLFVPVT